MDRLLAFLHLEVLMDQAASAQDVTSPAEKEWPDKYKIPDRY
jgi:hypothetical protein